MSTTREAEEKPPYPDHECEGCKQGMELMIAKCSSIVGQGAIHRPYGWVCMKWLEPKAYAAYQKIQEARTNKS